MSDTELRALLARTISADRSLTIAAAEEVASIYLAWRDALPGRTIAPWEERKASRFVDGAWLWEGRPSVVFAGQGRGKSNFAAWVIEKVLETRPTWDVYTNLPFPWDPDGGGPPETRPGDRIHPISRLSEVLRGTAESVLAGRKPALILDEMDQAVTSHAWASDAAQSWGKLVMIERHLKIRGPLLVYHSYRHVPVELREGTMLRSMMQVIIKDGARWVIRREEEGFLNVPATVLPYLAYGLRGFDIDVDVQDLERHLSGGGGAVARQVIAYLDRQLERIARSEREEDASEQEQEDRQALRAAVCVRLDQGATVREIAEDLGVSKTYVGGIRLAWAATRVGDSDRRDTATDEPRRVTLEAGRRGSVSPIETMLRRGHADRPAKTVADSDIERVVRSRLSDREVARDLGVGRHRVALVRRRMASQPDAADRAPTAL